MTSFDSRLGLSGDGNFRNKIKVAVLKVATDIVGEIPAAGPKIPKDDKRHALGVLILTPGAITSYTLLFAEACAALGTLTIASTDADVEFTVTSIWDDLAGVTGAEA